MKKYLLFFVIMYGVLGLAHAQIPKKISYQGFYKNSSNNPVNGQRQITFRFYKAGTNDEVTELVREVSTMVNQGIISVIIGDGGSTGPNRELELADWEQPLEIGISVNDTIVGGRVLLTTVPYAFVAGSIRGSGIQGPIPDDRLEETLDRTEINATGNITAGGIHVGGVADPGADNLVVDGALKAGAEKFTVDGDGNITKINDVSYSFPASPPGTKAFLENNGMGTLTWASTLDVANGGTGSSDAESARGNLGAAAAGANADITSLSGITTPLSVAQGGTGSGNMTGVMVGDGSQNITGRTGTANQYLRKNAADSDYEFAALSVKNTDIDADAAIVDSKLAMIATAGKVSGGAITSGTIGGTAGISSSGNVVTTGHVSATAGIHVGSTSAPSAGNLEVDGYARLGGGSGVSVTSNPSGASFAFPLIRMIKITGTCAAPDQTATVAIAGITDARILSIQVLVDGTSGNDFIPPGFTAISGYQYQFNYDGGTIYIRNQAGNSSALNGRPYRIIIIYEQ